MSRRGSGHCRKPRLAILPRSRVFPFGPRSVVEHLEQGERVPTPDAAVASRNKLQHIHVAFMMRVAED